MMSGLVLSTFTGAGLLDRGFIEAGYCVVSAGDPMFGQPAIEGFHPPAGAFEGVIGGPPCQMWAQSHNLAGDKSKHANLIPEFERVVAEAQPEWFLMENVIGAPVPEIAGYHIVDRKIHAWELGSPQRRYRRFSFGSKPPVQFMWPSGEKPPKLGLTLTGAPTPQRRRDGQRNAIMPTLLADHDGGAPKSTLNPDRYEHARKVLPTLAGANSTQRRSGETKSERINGKTCFTLDDYRYGFGLPDDWDAPALLKEFKFKVLGNGVPLQVACALAEAVRYATRQEA